ncbi:ABC transporter permease [Microbacterium lacticum]|uniref:ABC transporter permease n=1 Tax=Microbacterium lacticum TaxID=33885 RepID=UPI001F58F292|nr:ABC transporter permease [Microbacterium lacticum]
MIAAIRSEALRAVSGLSLWATYVLAIFVPVAVLTSDPSLTDLSGLDDSAATARLLQPLAWSFVTAAFAGAYAVTREWYYASMDRTLTEVGFRRAFWGKMVAGVMAALWITVGVCIGWTVVVLIVLSQEGRTFTLSQPGVQVYAGALIGVVPGALIGGAVGWITRNYYIGAAAVLAFPILIEFALIRTSPDLARFSPGMAIAAIGVPEYQGHLLSSAAGACIALAWTVVLVVAAWFLGRRRVA